MAVLDSDILVGLLRGDAQAKKKIEETIKNNEAIATTTINSFELFKG
ncbi:MAG: type II toxin-antitoxin system VapC family toxin, partial [Candidatus Aenigmarchaeota archaeon]|nr:type II toxin-antitoxin system VapC family toxin [Candidatus Aenigmarchaeota archaeon]